MPVTGIYFRISTYKNHNTRVVVGIAHTYFYFSSYKNCNTGVVATDILDWLLVFAFSLVKIKMQGHLY